MMMAKLFAGATAKNYVRSDTLKREFLALKDTTFDAAVRESNVGSWTTTLQPMFPTYYASYLMMLKFTAMNDRDHAPFYDNFMRTNARSNESYGALRRISGMLQKFGWACKCDECRQFGTNHCGNNDILYIGLTRDPNACCVEAYDGTPTDGVTAHGFFCFHALLLMQQNARDNDECEIMCVCKKAIDAWLPMRRGIMHEDDLTPGTPWSEGDVAPVPLNTGATPGRVPKAMADSLQA